MNKRYDGTDFSADWKVVSYEGKILVDANGKPLTGFSNYRKVAQAAKAVGGIPVRQ